jgi:hypothetical protein
MHCDHDITSGASNRIDAAIDRADKRREILSPPRRRLDPDIDMREDHQRGPDIDDYAPGATLFGVAPSRTP